MGVCFDVKQRLRVFCRGNVARLDLFIILLQQTVRRDQSKRKDQWDWSVFWRDLKKTCPIPNSNTAISQSETNQCRIRAALKREANLWEGKVVWSWIFINDQSAPEEVQLENLIHTWTRKKIEVSLLLTFAGFPWDEQIATIGFH